ncbi:MAG TPA: Rieske 2Fe-2S domain-containing protein [Frankiaceae bacterium]|jgi:nitrite reductase/ring-hydroxylating ferredoxin subunit|nr:Rieske 2Fe-2S domain-containing protein [Frankiaceae bacterium]
MRLRYQVDRLERSPRIDPLVGLLDAFWGRVLPKGRARDALHGTWLGHPLHPVLTDVPIGAWWSALLLDVLGGDRTAVAARRLVGAGVLAAVPTAVTGATDWTSLGTLERPRRVGAVHAVANGTATVLYTASWLARRKGDHAKGRALGFAGAAFLNAGGYLGGHLAYRNAVGVDHTAGESQVGEWTDVGNLRELPMRQAVRRRVGDADVLLYRIGSTVRAISATCSHMGGPLEEGTIAEDCVTCPWHGSTFDLTDGGVVRGPATAPQPAYEVRVVGRTVQVRREPRPSREALAGADGVTVGDAAR